MKHVAFEVICCWLSSGGFSCGDQLENNALPTHQNEALR